MALLRRKIGLLVAVSTLGLAGSLQFAIANKKKQEPANAPMLAFSLSVRYE